MRVTGWRCAVCAATVDIATPFPWRCPNSTSTTAATSCRSSRATSQSGSSRNECPSEPDANPYVRYDHEFAWAAYADANGMDPRWPAADSSGARRSGRGCRRHGFRPTPFGRSDALSDALGFTDGGGVWVKDETGGVGGSQKARHLFTILLHLRAAEELGHLTTRPPLAIASCGNAALAAATLAQAADWPIDVFVPTWMTAGFGDELDRLGARIHRCERRATDPPGDPAMFRFREAVTDGAIPFTVQGPENALALDGGRTIGWEIRDQLAGAGIDHLDRIFVQVGGGAFAACLGATAPARRFHAVQTEGCAPLARAWARALDAGTDGRPELAAPLWAELMVPWENPHSIADGILDDETYDWIGVFEAIGSRGDVPVVATEADIVAAHSLAQAAGFDVSATGSAGLAGLLATIEAIQPNERVAVVMSGIAR
jgi:threonine synthase